jgi:hypothetical protein
MEITFTAQQLQGVRAAFAERPHLWLPTYSRFGDLSLFIAFLDLLFKSAHLSTPRKVTLKYKTGRLAICAQGVVYTIESAGLVLDESKSPFWYIQQAQRNGRRFTETDALMPFVFLSQSFALEISTEQHHVKTIFAGDDPVNAPFAITPRRHAPYISIECALRPEYATKPAFSNEELATYLATQWTHLNIQFEIDIQVNEEGLVVDLVF